VSIEQARQNLSQWAAESHRAFLDFAEGLEVDRAAVEADPPRLLPVLDAFAASLPFDELEEDDWVWLTTSAAVSLAEVILHTGRARWDVTPGDSGRVLRVLRVQGYDDREHTVAPFDYAYGELSRRPPVFTRALAAMEVQAGLSPDVDDDDTAWSSGARRMSQ
jgi:hypothetical protein